MLQGIETIFDDLEQMLHHLKKKSYEANTEVFVRENGFYFEEMLFCADLKENYLDFVLTK